MAMRIQDVMVREVVTIDASATVVEAAQRMAEANVGVLPVIDDGELCGVVTDRDLVVRVLAREADPRFTRAGDCATTEVVAARPEWNVDQALELMSRHHVGRLPVVDDDERPIGMVTLSSLTLRSRGVEEALSAAKEVSRRSAKGAAGPASRSGAGAREARKASRRPSRAQSNRAATRKEGGKRRLKRAS
jgi:CBS domain-containing protein